MDRCQYNEFVGCNMKNCDDCEVCKVYQKGRADERKEVIEILARLVTCEVITLEQYELIRLQIGVQE